MFTLNSLIYCFNQIDPTKNGGILMNIIPIILVFGVLYLTMIRPQMKRQKEHRNLISILSDGDEIITNSGILGKINKIKENYLMLEISESSGKSVEMIIQKAAVSSVLPKGTIKSL